MKLKALATLISVLALLTSCTKEPSKDSGPPTDSSHVKAVLLEKLSAYQSKADGLYAISNGLLHVGSHSVDLMPVLESEGSKQGKSIAAMRIEVAVDGIKRPEASFGAIGIADSRQEAITVGLGEWYLGFALPLFQAVGEKKPSLVITDYDIFAGALGLRGSTAQGWIDGSDAMNRKVLDAVLPTVSRQDFVTLDLKVMVPAAGQPQSECRINGAVSTEIASRLIALDWPRTADGYMFKQAFVLKRKKPTHTAAGPGAVEAKKDISKGVLALENIGCPTHIPRDVAEVLQRKYGIQFRLVAFDMFSDEEYEHVEAYNGVMRPAIERRFGKGVWNAAFDEAVRLDGAKTVPNTGN